MQLAAKVIKLRVIEMLKCEYPQIKHNLIFFFMIQILKSVVQEIKNSYDYRRARIPSK